MAIDTDEIRRLHDIATPNALHAPAELFELLGLLPEAAEEIDTLRKQRDDRGPDKLHEALRSSLDAADNEIDALRKEVELYKDDRALLSQICDAVDVPSDRLHDWAVALREEVGRLTKHAAKQRETIAMDPMMHATAQAEAMAAVLSHPMECGHPIEAFDEPEGSEECAWCRLERERDALRKQLAEAKGIIDDWNVSVKPGGIWDATMKHATDTRDARIAELESALLAMPDDNSPEGVEYTDWLTGADGTRKQPYPQKRNRGCAIGYHQDCTDPAGEWCGCPCHKLAAGQGSEE